MGLTVSLPIPAAGPSGNGGGHVADWAAARPDVSGPPPLPIGPTGTGRRVYSGRVEAGAYRVRVTEAGEWAASPTGDSSEYELKTRPELFTTPPPPFRWGDGGAGTAHLAATLLVDLLGGDLPAVRAALPFFRRFFAQLPADEFEISESVFRAILFAIGGGQQGGAAPGGRAGASDPNPANGGTG